ncbi:MAG: hypothetical protein ACK5F7_23840 [Planctomycetaceae bacterium]|jgi:hypothetical protein
MLASTARVANHLPLDNREEVGGTRYRGAATGEVPSLSARIRDLTPYRPQFCRKKSPDTFSVDLLELGCDLFFSLLSRPLFRDSSLSSPGVFSVALHRLKRDALQRPPAQEFDDKSFQRIPDLF